MLRYVLWTRIWSWWVFRCWFEKQTYSVVFGWSDTCVRSWCLIMVFGSTIHPCWFLFCSSQLLRAVLRSSTIIMNFLKISLSSVFLPHAYCYLVHSHLGLLNHPGALIPVLLYNNNIGGNNSSLSLVIFLLWSLLYLILMWELNSLQINDCMVYIFPHFVLSVYLCHWIWWIVYSCIVGELFFLKSTLTIFVFWLV